MDAGQRWGGRRFGDLPSAGNGRFDYDSRIPHRATARPCELRAHGATSADPNDCQSGLLLGSPGGRRIDPWDRDFQLSGSGIGRTEIDGLRQMKMSTGT